MSLAARSPPRSRHASQLSVFAALRVVKKDGGAGGIRTHTGQHLGLLPLPLGYDPIGGGGGIRTHTVLILSQVPLPVGVHLRWLVPVEGLEPPSV